MMRPRRMKRLELTVLERDVDRVIEYLGRRAVMHLSAESGDEAPAGAEDASAADLKSLLDRLRSQADYLAVALKGECDEDTRLPGADDFALAESLIRSIESMASAEAGLEQERRKVEEALGEARAFANLNAPYSELDQLSYLTLRIGRLDPKKREGLAQVLGERAVLVSLGGGDRVLAASSRKGRFALDTELKKVDFLPITVPEGFTGVPGELLSGLEERLGKISSDLAAAAAAKAAAAEELGPALKRLSASFLMAAAVAKLRSRLTATRRAFRLGGWVAADAVASTVSDLEVLTDGRLAVRSYDPEEVEGVTEGREKVPVSLDHGPFVQGFQGVVFSYGAPLYGTIDPTPFVALSFSVLFGLMFGDLGQGFVLFLLGLLTGRRGPAFMASLRRFSMPLKAVGVSSMIVGLLDGEVFATEDLLIRPTRAITGFLTGVPVDRILHLMPEKGHLDKLFMFFAFTIGVGVVINSVGLVINMVNQFGLKRYEKALFAKTGLAGAALFWYALFCGIRIALGGSFAWFDILGLALPAAALFTGPALWRLISRERPVFEHGAMVFFMEGFVELLETASSYISNTVSFLRVGAFALSHAVLSFIVFSLSDMVRSAAFAGPVFAFLVLVLGNAVIILLEGMIVAIQVVRLQYYEFFSKFFTETGVEFSPFRFRREVQQ